MSELLTEPGRWLLLEKRHQTCRAYEPRAKTTPDRVTGTNQDNHINPRMSVRRRKVNQRIEREARHQWATYQYLTNRRAGIIWRARSLGLEGAELQDIEDRLVMPTKPYLPKPDSVR